MKNWTKLRSSSTSGHTKSIYSSFESFSRLRNECLSSENLSRKGMHVLFDGSGVRLYLFSVKNTHKIISE